jgi:adenosylcobinamide kinase/adenosylcobinamide-phosphate guanylyltransferase
MACGDPLVQGAGHPAYSVPGVRAAYGAADHLNLRTFADTVELLRQSGVVTGSTDVVAVHVGHHNPPLPELAERLATVPARVVSDGTTLVAGAPAGRPESA